MIIILLIIATISGFLYRNSKIDDNKDASYWKEFLTVVSLKVVDYYYKDSPTKVVMLALRTLGLMFELSAIGYPVINAGLSYDKTNGFWNLLMKFQWDSVSSTMCYCYIVAIALIVIVYLITNGKKSKIEGIFHDLNKSIGIVETTVASIDSNVRGYAAKFDGLSDQMSVLMTKFTYDAGSSVIKHLLHSLQASILTLKIRSAYDYLQEILKEVEINYSNDYELKAIINYMLGECAKYIKNVDSKLYHEKAYHLMKTSKSNIPDVIEGMIYECCRNKKYVDAQEFADELKEIERDNYWCYMPKLMNSDDLRTDIKEIPEAVNKYYALACVLMLGGSRSNDIGFDINTYQYNRFEKITTENFPLWIMDLSVATTLFCQKLVFNKEVNSMYDKYASDLFEISDRYISLINKTDMDNILPDTIFIHALTGYLKDQNSTWIEIMGNAKANDDMKEIYNLGYAFILENANRYDEAKAFLKKDETPCLASIINARFMFAYKNNDIRESVDVFKSAANKQVCFPDQFISYLFSSVCVIYDSIKEYTEKIKFENDLTHQVFVEFVNYQSHKDVDVNLLIKYKDDFQKNLLPFVAIIAKKMISIDFAIELLERCVDKKILDIRSHLLIDYYKEIPACRQKLYHLLSDLRSAGNIEINNLDLELQLSIDVLDNDNSLMITTEMMKLEPNNDSVLINHIQALYRHSDHKTEINSYKDRLLKSILPAKYTILLFDIYHTIDETAFAMEFLYQQILRTHDQTLKDFLFSRHLNPEINKLITPEKDIIEVDDFVVIKLNSEIKEIVVTSGSVYEDLCGHTKNDKLLPCLIDKDVIEILTIHSKYYKLMKDIFEELKVSASSRSIKMFNMDDFGFKDDPLGALQKIAGRTDDQKQREEARLLQYRNGETPLLCFVNDSHMFYDLYNKLFDDFMVCNVSHELYKNFALEDFDISKVEVVLDVSSLIMLHEYDMKYGLHYNKKFIIPKSIPLLLKQEIVNEEKGFPRAFFQRLTNKLTICEIDDSKTKLWNKFKNIEQWISDHCSIVAVEESVNFKQEYTQGMASKIMLDCILLAQHKRVLLTEDWFYTLKFLSVFPIMSAYNWLFFLRNEHFEEWGQWMLACGNVGYPMGAEYIRKQYDLCSQSKPNNYQTCLENMRYDLQSADEVIKAANSLFIGIVIPTDIVGATNMLTILFREMNDQLCWTFYQRELLTSKDKDWLQCFVDALKINHPLLFAH